MNEVIAAKWLWRAVVVGQITVSLILLAVLVLSALGCSLFRPVNDQQAIIPDLPRGGVWVADISDGLPLFSTPHRLMVWRDEQGQYHYAPEASQPNIFAALENLPSTAGSMIMGTAPAAAVIAH